MAHKTVPFSKLLWPRFARRARENCSGSTRWAPPHGLRQPWPHSGNHCCVPAASAPPRQQTMTACRDRSRCRIRPGFMRDRRRRGARPTGLGRAREPLLAAALVPSRPPLFGPTHGQPNPATGQSNWAASGPTEDEIEAVTEAVTAPRAGQPTPHPMTQPGRKPVNRTRDREPANRGNNSAAKAVQAGRGGQNLGKTFTRFGRPGYDAYQDTGNQDAACRQPGRTRTHQDTTADCPHQVVAYSLKPVSGPHKASAGLCRTRSRQYSTTIRCCVKVTIVRSVIPDGAIAGARRSPWICAGLSN
jgi:hypothetical protein